jgi:hypothetical protein
MSVYAAFDPASDVIDDPDFITPIAVLRSNEQIGPGGLALVTATIPGGVVVNAIVTPDPGRDLVISSNGVGIQADIKIITRFPLSLGGTGYTADLVRYAGREYRVISVKPYLYGSGWVKAQAKMTSINPVPETPAGDTTPSLPPASGGFLDQ